METEQKRQMYLTYRVEKGENPFAVIQKVDEEIGVVQIPEELEGVPVRELAPYAMSGGSHIEICLPAGLRSIGRYAFYNCRKLQILRFSTDICDIGSGAFTGCHQVRYLDVQVAEGTSSCLKEILSELPEELQVDLRGREKARLFFPEYYEEGVENTPARILMTQVHGSGIWYRNCFRNREFCYAEYDGCFEKAVAQEEFSFLVRLAAGRLQYPRGLTEKGRERYLRFFRENLLEAGSYFLQEKDEEGLAWLLQLCPWDRDIFEGLEVCAGRLNKPEIHALLAQYRRTHFPAGRKRRSL